MVLVGAKSLTVLSGSNERLNHLRVNKVPVEGIQLIQLKVKAGRIGITTQITEVFHRHKRAIKLGSGEGRVFPPPGPARSPGPVGSALVGAPKRRFQRANVYLSVLTVIPVLSRKYNLT